MNPVCVIPEGIIFIGWLGATVVVLTVNGEELTVPVTFEAIITTVYAELIVKFVNVAVLPSTEYTEGVVAAPFTLNK